MQGETGTNMNKGRRPTDHEPHNRRTNVKNAARMNTHYNCTDLHRGANQSASARPHLYWNTWKRTHLHAVRMTNRENFGRKSAERYIRFDEPCIHPVIKLYKSRGINATRQADSGMQSTNEGANWSKIQRISRRAALWSTITSVKSSNHFIWAQGTQKHKKIPFICKDWNAQTDSTTIQWRGRSTRPYTVQSVTCHLTNGYTEHK